MGDWLGYLQLTAKAKTGVTGIVLVSAGIAALAAAATLTWLSITLFLWLADRLDSQILAGTIVSAIFLVIALIAALVATMARRRAQERAELMLQARKAAALFDPSMLTVGLEIGRAIGWRRVATAAAMAFLAMGVIKEMGQRRERKEAAPDDAEGPQKQAAE